MSFADIIKNRPSTEVEFLGSKVTIQKLSAKDVMQIQKLSKSTEEADSDTEKTEKSIGVLIATIRMAIPEAKDIPDDIFTDIPFEDLQQLSETILDKSGVGKSQKDTSEKKA